MLRLGENTRRFALVAAVAGAIAVAALLAATVVLPLLVPAAELRRAAIEAVAGTTAQGVTISGDPALRLLPAPRLVLHKVTFTLPHGQSLDAEAVVSRISLWPLVFGQISVSEVILESPTLVLTGEQTSPELGIAPFLAAADAPELRVVDGTIAWRTDSGLTRELVSGISARIDRIAGGEGIGVSAVFDWRDSAVEANLAVDDVKAFLAGTLTPTRASLSASTVNVQFRGQSGYARSMAANGTVTADADSLRATLEWLGLPGFANKGFGAFSFSSQVALDNHAVSFSNTIVDLDGNRGDGALLVKLDGDRPAVQGTFAAERLNLNPYGRMRLTTDGGREWSREPFDLSLLDTFDLDLRLSAGQITAESTTFTTVAASAVLSGGRLVLALGQTGGWNGMLRGTATLSPSWSGRGHDHKGLSLKVEGECTDIALEAALEDLAGLNVFEGPGTLQFALQGEGRSAQDIAHSLSGQVALMSTGGYLTGFDVAQVLRRIERRPLSGADDLRGGRTAFTRLEARAALGRGIATLNPLKLEGKQVRLDMSGTVDVGQRSLDLSGGAALTAPAKAGETAELALPFLIQGPWASPRIMVDPLSLIERSDAALPLLEAVKNRKAAPSRVHTLIENLVKPAAPVAESTAGPAN